MDKKDVLKNCIDVEGAVAQQPTNPDIRAISGPYENMTTEQKEQLRIYAEFMFPEAFNEK